MTLVTIKVTQNFDKMNQSRTYFHNEHTKFVKNKKNQIKEDTEIHVSI